MYRMFNGSCILCGIYHSIYLEISFLSKFNMTTFEEGTMSLYFKDFARFLMRAVFSLNH